MEKTLDGADVLWLDDVRLADMPRVGAKFARLGALRSLGARVPDAFVLTTSAFDTFLGPERQTLERIVDAAAAGLEDEERIGQAARAFVEQHPFPDALYRRITQAFAELSERTGLGDKLSTAVRSSGVTEDGAQASFAGQYDSYLGLCSADYRRRRGVRLCASGGGIAVGVILGESVVEQAAPAEQAARASLSDEEVRELVRLAAEIEEREGRPQDVEWAVDSGQSTDTCPFQITSSCCNIGPRRAGPRGRSRRTKRRSRMRRHPMIRWRTPCATSSK